MSFSEFCPKCGVQGVSFIADVKLECDHCCFVLYHNVAAAVAVIFTYKNKILFTVRNVNPDKGKLDLPGGFIDPNENATEAACREIREELGIEISENQLRYRTTAPNTYFYREVPYKTLDIFYECELNFDGVQVAAQDEIKALVWLEKSDINPEKIAFDSVKKVIQELYQWC
ncbi:NUDIX hydrolase [Flavobacterium aciduliphilum]|uniref:ADP-ribose pyrophosphatase YjhB (NUDIX family) n=1 Tax=Flavobacterium aciduliphilum TaxID=1101402 RepID=A0A328Y9P2_9FLAO|nr:NUDIX domain-containing protein [Flavobacterium aciduliphilum]RAR70791.1 ADP-ribose pyrophosphatase YjhB (NUDIX family) [Flavobacterium aciduliphilum]